MTAADWQKHVDQEYMVNIRRELHMYPELGWELEKTSALVRRELDKIGIPYEADVYGRNSVVATIRGDITRFTIGIRADMDALPIQEAPSDKPYRSKIDGVMHACGHDAHTAMLLGAAKALWAIRENLNCRIKLIFQPSEESKPSGAKTMCEHGVMKDIDRIIMCHVNCVDHTHVLSSCSGITNATSCAFHINIRGKGVHVASPHKGVDALAIGIKIYMALQMIISRELDPFDTCVLGVGKMNAGNTIAQVPEVCEMSGSMRCLKESTRDWMQERIKRLVKSIAEDMGGEAEAEFAADPLPPAYNDSEMYSWFVSSAKKVVGDDKVIVLEPSPGGEDFAYYEKEKPGLLFGLGMRNEEKGCTSGAHSALWDIDEDALQTGAKTFVQFVIDHMDKNP
ncbi:MAG: amidohydrolase [Clostridia bacterium]|nr:amidohydrolase [Clostridia bacterium]